MKKFLKIISAIILLFVVAIFALPYFYKDKIVNYIKADINKNINAKVDFKDVDLSLFKSFPNFNLGIDQLTVDGVETFKNVRLLEAKDLNLTLDIKSVFGGDQIKINKIGVEHAKVNILVLENGKANYDITKPSDTQSEPSKFNIDLKQYFIKNSDLIYDDKSMGFKAELKNLNHVGSGKLSEKIYELKTKSTVDTLTITYGNIDYLHKVKADVTTDFDISGDFSKFTLKNTLATINDLPIKADGFVEMKENEIVMDINYKTENANIAQLLSLVPKVYMPDLTGVKTGGVAKLSGFVKGHSTETDLPGFKLLVDVQNASIQYSDLPEKISNINLLTDVDFKGGSDLNTMTVDLPKIVFDIAGSRVSGNLNVKQPMTDPYISAAFKSKLDFVKVKQAVKFEQIKDLSGILDADIAFSGLVSAMANQQVDKINAKGFFNLTNFKMKSDAFKDVLQIPSAQLNLTPAQLNITQFNSIIGANDFALTGSISNYLAYFLGKNEVLKGNFIGKSKYLNLNDFMTESTTKTSNENQTNSPETVTTGIIKVPANLDLNFNLTADKIKYQKLDLNNLVGVMKVANQEIKLSELNMNLLGGKVQMSGFYNTAGTNAKSNLSINLDQMGIKESANSFDMFNSYAPVLKNMTGNFFSNLSLNVDLDENMNPILKSINSQGNFKTNEISANGINVMKKVGEILKINELLNPKIDKLNASFTIKDGTLTLKPNQFKLNGMQAGLSGTFNLDKQLNLELTLDVPREKLGNNLNGVINNIAGAANKLDLGKDIGQVVKTKFKITGLATNPQIKPVLLGSSGETLSETVTQVVQDKVETVKNDALAKAQIESDKLMAAAKLQKEKLVSEAEKLAQETKDKAKLAGDELLKNAGDNPLKKMAAQTAADKLIKEGDKKAKQIVDTANKKGDELVQKAQIQADELMNKAKETGSK
jgi:hypothetical protein